MPYDENGNYTPHAPYTIDKTYKIVGTYKGQTEDVETDIETMEDADYLLGEYRLAFGNNWTLAIEEE